MREHLQRAAQATELPGVARERPCERNIATAQTCAARTMLSRPRREGVPRRRGMTLSPAPTRLPRHPPGSASPVGTPGLASPRRVRHQPRASAPEIPARRRRSYHAPPVKSPSSGEWIRKSDSHAVARTRGSRVVGRQRVYRDVPEEGGVPRIGRPGEFQPGQGRWRRAGRRHRADATRAQEERTPRSRCSAARNGP